MINSEYLFGIIQIIFFIILFYNSYSKERENHTLDLLYTQPSDKRKILFSIFISLILSIALYIISTLVFSALILFIQEIPFRGFKDIYRILIENDEIIFDTGLIAICKLLLGFTLLIIFFSSIAIILGVLFNSEKALGIIVIIFSILYIFTENILFLQSIFNPIYAVNIVKRIYGGLAIVTKNDGKVVDELLKVSSYLYYLIFLIVAVVLLYLVSFSKKEVAYKDKLLKRRKIKSIFNFESIKVLNNSGFLIYLFGFIVIVASLFVIDSRLSKDYSKNYISDYHINSNNYVLEDLEKQMERMQSQEYKDSLFSRNGVKVTEKEWNDDARRQYNEDLERIKFEIEKEKIFFNKYNNYIQAYKEKKSKVFYEFEKDIINKEFEQYIHKFKNKVIITEKSREFNKDIYQKAAEWQTKPILRRVIYISPFEEFTNEVIKEDLMKNAIKYDSDGFYFIYKLIKNKSFDVIFLILIILMAITGFTNDKEYGNQIEFMNLQPYKKEKLLISKVLSQAFIGIFIITALFIFIMGVSGIVNGFGTYNYPVAIYSQNKYEFVPLWNYILRVYIILNLLVLFISSLMTLVSTFVKSKDKLYALTILISFIMMTLNKYLPKEIQRFNPLIYLKANLVADNSLMLIKNIPNANFVTSIFVLIIGSLTLMIVNSMIIKKKEIVNE